MKRASAEEKPILAQHRKSHVFYSALFFLLFLILFLIKAPRLTASNVVSYYFCLDYSMGFGSRMFVGSILNVLFNGYITGNRLYFASLTVTLAVCALTATLMGGIWLRVERQRGSVTCLFALLLLYPFSVNFFFSNDCFGRLEIYCLLFSMLSLFLLNKRGWRWLIPFFCFAAIATYEAFVLTLMPIIAVALLYKVIRNGFKARDISLCIVSYAVIVLSFVYFQFITKRIDVIVYDNVFEMLAAISQKTDIQMQEDARNALMVQYFLGSSTYWRDTIVPILKDLLMNYLPVLVLSAAPALFIVLGVWRACFKASASIHEKFFFVICALLPIAAAPMYILSTDWGRWTACFIIAQITTLLYLVSENDITVIGVLDSLNETVKKSPFLPGLFLLFSACLYLSSTPNAFIGAISEKAMDNWLQWLENLY